MICDCRCCFCSKYDCEKRCPYENPDDCHECLKSPKEYTDCDDYDEEA